MSSSSCSKHENDNESSLKNQQAINSDKEFSPQLLQLANETDQILHHSIGDMSLEEILSLETKQIVANMIYSIRPEQLQAANAPFNKAAGMAANQWNIRKRIFLFCPTGSDQEIKVIFNPKYKPVILLTENHGVKSKSESTNFAREGCFSVPCAFGTVERYTNIEISYIDDKGVEHRNEQLSGWQARVWQHETDHLNGILYSNRQSDIDKGPNCTEFHRFQSKDEMEAHRK